MVEAAPAPRGSWPGALHPSRRPAASLTWDNQRWIRYRVHLDLLERKGREARRGFLDASLGTPLAELRLAPPSFPWEESGQGKFADPDTDELLAQFAAWDEDVQAFSAGAPSPPAEPWSIPRL